jgi:hypothetical protein
MKQLLRVSEAARFLNISRARCYELARKGDFGRRIGFDPEQLENFLINGGFSFVVPSADGGHARFTWGSPRDTLRNSNPSAWNRTHSSLPRKPVRRGNDDSGAAQ